MFVRVSVAVIVAPGTAAPLSSVTFPRSVPTATCAAASTGTQRIPSTARTDTTRNGKRDPVIAHLLLGWIRRLAYAGRLFTSRGATRRSGQLHWIGEGQYRADRARNPLNLLAVRPRRSKVLK